MKYKKYFILDQQRHTGLSVMYGAETFNTNNNGFFTVKKMYCKQLNSI